MANLTEDSSDLQGNLFNEPQVSSSVAVSFPDFFNTVLYFASAVFLGYVAIFLILLCFATLKTKGYPKAARTMDRTMDWWKDFTGRGPIVHRWAEHSGEQTQHA